MGCEVDFIDHQQVGFGNTRPTFARNLVACRDVDDINCEVGQLGAEGGGQIVTAAFDEDDIEPRKFCVEVVDRREIHRRVFANRRVWATAGLDTHDAIFRQRLCADQNLLIFFGVNIVGHDGDVVGVAQAFAQGFDQRSFAGTDRTTDADAQGRFVSLSHC